MSRPSFGELAGEDPFEILGLSRDAGPDDIRAARRRLLRVHHPDLPTGDLQRTQMITAAADILLDPVRLTIYQEVAAEREAARAAAHAAAATAVRRGWPARVGRRTAGADHDYAAAGTGRGGSPGGRHLAGPGRSSYTEAGDAGPGPGRPGPGSRHAVRTTSPAGRRPGSTRGPHPSAFTGDPGSRRAGGHTPRHAAVPNGEQRRAWRPGRRYSPLAVVAAVCAASCTPLGLPVGLAALWEINRTGRRGRALALFGVAAGAALLAGYVALAVQGF
jgi:curved DNA-binding protein CbpA